MSRFLHVDPSDAMPIWKQIEDGVRRLVASENLRAGDVLPSVRELASELRVNPNTVAKAYQSLTAGGVLEVRRGEGTYVAAVPPLSTRPERSRELRGGALRYGSLAASLGASRHEALGEVRTALRRLAGEKR